MPAPPATMTPNQSLIISAVTVKNTGSQVWPASGVNRVEFTYDWLSSEGNFVAHGAITLLAHDVAPGELITFNAKIMAPPSPGKYIIRPTMIAEQIAWFNTLGGATMEFPVNVVPQ